MAKPLDPAELKGYTLADIPNPLTVVISNDAKAITIALLAIATEIRRAAVLFEPQYELNKFNADQTAPMRRAAEGGIIPSGLIGSKPGNG